MTAHKDDGYPLKVKQLVEDIRIAKEKAETYHQKLYALDKDLAAAESAELKVSEADSAHLGTVEEFMSLEQVHKVLLEQQKKAKASYSKSELGRIRLGEIKKGLNRRSKSVRTVF